MNKTAMNKTANEYNIVINQIAAITKGERNMIANMANISAIIFNGLPDLNWAGFYLCEGQELVLGPFQGQPACIRIPFGRGVCGTAIATQTIQVIQNVHDFDGHIACDANSNSELVVPIIRNGELIGVLDIDSPLVSRFDQKDADCFSKIVDILIDTLD